MQELEKIWMNGELVDWADAKIHVGSHGLHYGSGVFEGIRAYETPKGSAVFRLTEHLQRLQNSAQVLNMELPYTVDELRSATLELIGANGVAECYIRPIAFFGLGELGVASTGNPVDVVIMSWPWGAYLGPEAGHGVKQNGEPLPRFVAANKQNGGALGGPRIGLGEAGHVDPVEDQLVPPTERLGRGGQGVVRDSAAELQLVGGPPCDGPDRTVGGAPTGPVERSDHRGVGEQERRHGRPGHEWFVQMQQVELLVPQDPDGSQRAGRIGGDGRHRSVRGGRYRLAERYDRRVRRRTVARSQDPSVDAEAAKCSAQTDDLLLDATGNRQAVGADQAETHQLTVLQ